MNIIANSSDQFFSGGNMGCYEYLNGELITNATNSTLLKDQHIELTSLVKAEYQKSTVLLNDVRSAGLTSRLDGLGTLIAEWQREGDITGAQIDMDARTVAQNDRVQFDITGTPVPITHKSFNVHTRHELASQRGGRPSMSSRMGVLAAIKVGQSNEQTLLDGVPGLTVDQKKVYGYRTHPSRITGTTSADWAVSGGDAIVSDTLDIVDALRADLIDGDVTIYVAEDIWTNLQNDYSATKGSNTIYDRVLAIAQVGMLKPARFLADGEVIAVTLNAQTIDVAIAQDTSVVQWNVLSPFETEYKVFNALVPILMDTKSGRLGLAHFNKA